MKILFSPVGGTDPITNFRDGAMLHICRHYLPDVVYLYLSGEMCALHDASNAYLYCIEQLGKQVNHHFACHIIRRDDLQEVQVFDTFIEEFDTVIKSIQEEVDDNTLYVNVSSGTPAMKSALLLLSVLSDGALIPIQVSTPQKKMNPRVEEKNIQYDPIENWEVNEDNEPGAENRTVVACSTNWIGEVKKEIIKKHIDAYHYVAALQIAEGMEYLDPLCKSLLKAAAHRLKLDILNLQGELKGHVAENLQSFLPVRNDQYRMIVESALSLQIKLKKEEYADFIRALSPLLKDMNLLILKQECQIDVIRDYSKKGFYGSDRWDKDKLKNNKKMVQVLYEKWGEKFRFDSNIENSHLACLVHGLVNNKRVRKAADMLRTVEENIRNDAAHQLISVTSDVIKKRTGSFPDEIMIEIRFLIDHYIDDAVKNDVWTSYQQMNAVIKGTL